MTYPFRTPLVVCHPGILATIFKFDSTCCLGMAASAARKPRWYHLPSAAFAAACASASTNGLLANRRPIAESDRLGHNFSADWAGPSVLPACFLRKALFFWCVVLWLLSATVWGCNCPHELFFPVMSDDSPLVRGDPVPRGPNRRGTGPLVSPLTWQRWRKTFRSSAAPRHAAVSATSRHAGRRVREPSQARSRIPATSPLGLQ